MKKIDLGKPTTVINKNMNRKELYVDSKKMEKINKDIVKQLDILSKSLSEVEGILNKMSYKKMFVDEYNNVSVQCAKKCTLQAKGANTLKETLNDKYRDDIKMFVLNSLDERISYLESVILDKNN